MPKGVYKHHPHQLFQKGNKITLGRKASAETRRRIGEGHSGAKCHFWKGGITITSRNGWREKTRIISDG